MQIRIVPGRDAMRIAKRGERAAQRRADKWETMVRIQHLEHALPQIDAAIAAGQPGAEVDKWNVQAAIMELQEKLNAAR